MAERPELEAVVFDAGGTLVRLDFEWMADVATRVGHRTTTETMRRAEVAGYAVLVSRAAIRDL